MTGQIVAWKGFILSYVLSKHQGQIWLLYDKDDRLVDEIDVVQYFSNSGLRSLPHGRYRKPNSQNNRGPANAAGGAGDDDPFGHSPALSIRPGSLTVVSAAQVRAGGLLSAPNWVTQIGPEPKRPPLKREGIVAGEIVGYRCWRIENGWLRSVYQRDVWRPGETLVGREIEDWGSRGVHAWKSPSSQEYFEYIRDYLNASDSPLYHQIVFGHKENSRPAMVTGTVYLWGDVVEHEHGYRAEFARVRSIDWLYPDENMMGRESVVLNDLRGTYHV